MTGQGRNGGQRVIPRDVAGTVNGNAAKSPPLDREPRSFTPSQRRWRNLLVAALGRQGFVNYSKEWWHFSMPGAGGPAYDFPIKPRHD